ncbi:hypothetical protein R3P38DRAFT_3351179 [Favolaschia claudopus]|uniref:Uncharacterized protein n=1 Tax=Favolaschia claudopus TaxID=2862362 RepID=A0AAW0CBG5_9AGAR
MQHPPLEALLLSPPRTIDPPPPSPVVSPSSPDALLAPLPPYRLNPKRDLHYANQSVVLSTKYKRLDVEGWMRGEVKKNRERKEEEGKRGKRRTVHGYNAAPSTSTTVHPWQFWLISALLLLLHVNIIACSVIAIASEIPDNPGLQPILFHTSGPAPPARSPAHKPRARRSAGGYRRVDGQALRMLEDEEHSPLLSTSRAKTEPAGTQEENDYMNASMLFDSGVPTFRATGRRLSSTGIVEYVRHPARRKIDYSRIRPAQESISGAGDSHAKDDAETYARATSYCILPVPRSPVSVRGSHDRCDPPPPLFWALHTRRQWDWREHSRAVRPSQRSELLLLGMMWQPAPSQRIDRWRVSIGCAKTSSGDMNNDRPKVASNRDARRQRVGSFALEGGRAWGWSPSSMSRVNLVCARSEGGEVPCGCRGSRGGAGERVIAVLGLGEPHRDTGGEGDAHLDSFSVSCICRRCGVVHRARRHAPRTREGRGKVVSRRCEGVCQEGARGGGGDEGGNFVQGEGGGGGAVDVFPECSLRRAYIVQYDLYSISARARHDDHPADVRGGREKYAIHAVLRGDGDAGDVEHWRTIMRVTPSEREIKSGQAKG